MVKEIVRDYKKICPNVDVWVGGPEVSYNVEQVLRENETIDYVMYGEGELTFKEVMDKYNFNGIGIDDLKDILGIGYRKSKSFRTSDIRIRNRNTRLFKKTENPDYNQQTSTAC